MYFVRQKLVTVTLSYANYYQGSYTIIDRLENLNIYRTVINFFSREGKTSGLPTQRFSSSTVWATGGWESSYKRSDYFGSFQNGFPW